MHKYHLLNVLKFLHCFALRIRRDDARSIGKPQFDNKQTTAPKFYQFPVPLLFNELLSAPCIKQPSNVDDIFINQSTYQLFIGYSIINSEDTQ